MEAEEGLELGGALQEMEKLVGYRKGGGEGERRTSPQGYRREKRKMKDLNVSRSSAVGSSGKRAAIVCNSFQLALPSSALQVEREGEERFS